MELEGCNVYRPSLPPFTHHLLFTERAEKEGRAIEFSRILNDSSKSSSRNSSTSNSNGSNLPVIAVSAIVHFNFIFIVIAAGTHRR